MQCEERPQTTGRSANASRFHWVISGMLQIHALEKRERDHGSSEASTSESDQPPFHLPCSLREIGWMSPAN